MAGIPYLKHWSAALLLLASLYSNAQKSGNPTLIQAIQQKDMPAFSRLLKASVNVNATDSNGATPLMWAAYTGNIVAFKSLIRHGANTKSKGVIYPDDTKENYYGNITSIAAARNDTALLAYCLDSLNASADEKEYNPDTRTNDGWTALREAANQGNVAAIRLLLTHHASSNGVNAPDTYMPLITALIFSKPEICVNLLTIAAKQILPDTLIKKAADYAFSNENYSTALILKRWKDNFREQQINKLLDSIYTWKKVNNLADSLRDKGNYTAATKFGKQEIILCNLLFGPDHPEYASSLNNLATLHYYSGNYEEALPIFKMALETDKRIFGDSSTDYASTLANLGGLYRDMGNYAEALISLKKVLEIFKITHSESHPDYATSLNTMAIIYKDLGSYTDALPLYKQVLSIRKATRGENNNDYTISLNNLATLYQAMGNYTEAMPLFKRAVEITKALLGEHHPNYATYLHNLARLYQAMGNYEAALPLFKQAAEIRKVILGEHHPAYGLSLNNLALVYQSMHNYAAALPLLEQASGISKSVYGFSHPYYASSLYNLANFYQAQNNYAQAVPFFKLASDILIQYLRKGSTFMGQDMMMRFIDNNRSNFDFTNSAAVKIKDTILIKQAVAAELQFKSIALQNSRDLLEQIAQTKDTLLQQTLSRLRLVKSQLAKAYKANASEGQMAQLEGMFTNYEAQLIRQSPEYQEKIRNRNVQLQEVQQKLKSHEVAIEFNRFRYWNDRWTDTILYSAFLLLPDGPPQMVRLCTQKQLEQLLNDTAEQPVTQLYKDRGVQVLGKAPNYSLPSLYQLLWQPLDSLLTGVSTIYYAPTGLLHRINPAAISYSDNKVLGDKYAFHLMGSTRDIVTYQSEHINATFDTLLLYGGIDFDADSSALAAQHRKFYTVTANNNSFALRSGNYAQWSALDGTLEEINAIKDLAEAQHIPTRFFTGKEATEESFDHYIGQSKSPALIHIATHGFFFAGTQQRKSADGSSAPYFMSSANAMMRSGIVFAGANRVSGGREPLQGIEDGIATASDIAGTNLQQTKLAVLSACETGLGKIENSEGVFGLQRSFRMAGCKNLIMSLWKVPDVQTSMFMNYFYIALLQQKKSIYEAFQAAQKQMRTLYSGQPYFWAAFVLME